MVGKSIVLRRPTIGISIFSNFPLFLGRGDGSVGNSDYATGWTTTELWFDSRQEQKFCLFEIQTGSGYPELPVQWVLGSLSPRVKRPGLKSTSYVHLMPSLHACRDLNRDLFSSKDGCSPIELINRYLMT